MLKKHMAACLVATAFMAAPALAQTSSTPGASGSTDRPAASSTGSPTMGSPAMQPGSSGSSGSMTGTQSNTTTGQSTSPSTTTMSPSSTTTTTMSSSGSASGNFMNALQSGQFLASDLIGTTVVGQNNESIGDINDVVMGKDGKAMGIVVGVGGFLGIGEKDVAIPFEKVNFESQATASGANRSAETTGSTSGATTSTTAGSASSSNMSENNLPDRIVLPMTKDELKAAPSFRTSANDAADRPAAGATRAPGAGNTNPPAAGSAPARQ